MIKGNVIREIYLKSEPSVDLDLVPEGEQVDCCKHTIKMSVYEDIQKEYCENKDDEFYLNMFMLQSGPQLVEG